MSRAAAGGPVPPALVEPIEELLWRDQVLEHVRQLVAGGQTTTAGFLVIDLVHLVKEQLVREEDRGTVEDAWGALQVALWRAKQ